MRARRLNADRAVRPDLIVVCGERCRAGVPHGHWKTTTFTGALRLTGMSAPFIYDGTMNGIVFRAYVEQVLVPTFQSGDIVFRDNLSAHKAAGVREAIEQVDGTLMYLRPYSPDVTRPRTPSPSSRHCCGPEPNAPSVLCGTPWALLDAFTPAECATYFKAGYEPD